MALKEQYAMIENEAIESSLVGIQALAERTRELTSLLEVTIVHVGLIQVGSPLVLKRVCIGD